MESFDVAPQGKPAPHTDGTRSDPVERLRRGLSAPARRLDSSSLAGVYQTFGVYEGLTVSSKASRHVMPAPKRKAIYSSFSSDISAPGLHPTVLMRLERMDEDDGETEEAVGTTSSGTMQVLLVCLGLSCLTIPHIFAKVGWGLGAVIICIPAATSCVSMRTLVHLGDAARAKGMVGAFSPHLGEYVGLFIHRYFS